MKILSIEHSIQNEKLYGFINDLLANSMFNEHLFDRTFFDVVIEAEEYINFMYRRLWEDVYVKVGKSVYYKENNTFILKLSLSEAIAYIRQVTPPRLKNMIPDAIKTIDSIRDVLKQFLIDENSGYLVTYHSYFKKGTNFVDVLDTPWNHDDKRIDLLRNYCQHGLIVELDKYTCSFDEIIKGELKQEECFQMTFHCQNDVQIKRLCGIIEGMSDVNIMGIKNISGKGTFISIYTCLCNNLTRDLHDVIMDTYRPILNL